MTIGDACHAAARKNDENAATMEWESRQRESGSGMAT